MIEVLSFKELKTNLNSWYAYKKNNSFIYAENRNNVIIIKLYLNL